jgi:hypothetical protein
MVARHLALLASSRNQNSSNYTAQTVSVHFVYKIRRRFHWNLLFVLFLDHQGYRIYFSDIASPVSTTHDPTARSGTTVLSQAVMEFTLNLTAMGLETALLPNLFAIPMNPVMKFSGLFTQGNDDGDDAPIFKGQANPLSRL